MKQFYHSLKLGLVSPIYLFYGEETLLLEQAVQALSDFLAPGANPWNKEVYEGEQVSVAEIIEAAQAAGSFFGGKRLIIVKHLPWFDKKSEKKPTPGAGAKASRGAEQAEDPLALLTAYAADPNPDSCLLLIKQGSVDTRRKAVKAIAKQGRVINFARVQGGEREIWLKNYLAAGGKKAEPQALHYLSLFGGETLAVLRSELDKLLLYTQQSGVITLADCEQVISKSSAYTIFALTDAVAKKQAREALAVYRQLLRQGEAAQKILTMIAGQYRNMLGIADLCRQGYSASQAAQEFGLHPYAAEKALGFARAYSDRQLLKALELLLHVDIGNKSGEGKLEDLLETAILKLCNFG